MQCLDWCIFAELWGLIETQVGVLAILIFHSCEPNPLGLLGSYLKVVHCSTCAY